MRIFVLMLGSLFCIADGLNLTLIEAEEKTVMVKLKFPLRHLYNISPNFNIAVDPDLCSGSNVCCNCDDSCFKTRTCCIDKLWDDTKLVPSLDEYIDRFVARANQEKEHVCEEILQLGSSAKGHVSYKIMLVHSCAANATLDDQNNCVNDSQASAFDQIPVMGSDQVVYRSAACAKCNFVPSFKTMELRFDCKGGGPKVPGPKLENTTTTTHTQKPEGRVYILDLFERCSIDIVNYKDVVTCDQKNQKIKSNCPKSHPLYARCMAYQGKIGYTDYDNFDCFMCEIPPVPPGVEIGIPAFICNKDTSVITPDLFTWSVTIDYDGQVSRLRIEHRQFPPFTRTDDHFCDSGMIYDVVANECVPFVCTRGYKQEGQKCIQVQENTVSLVTTNPNFDTCLESRKNLLFVEVQCTSNLTQLQHHLQTNLNSTERLQLIHKDANLTSLYRFEFRNITNLANILNNLVNFAINIYIASEENQHLTKQYGLNPAKSFSNGRICAKESVYFDTSVSFNNTLCSISIKNQTLSDVTMWMTANATGTYRKMSVCNKFHLHSECTLQEIVSGYSVSLNGSLQIANSMFAPQEYQPTLKGVAVCNRKMPDSRKQWQITLNKVEYYFSIVLTSISIVCYIITIAVYVLLPELRQIPSLNATALCSVLLIADVVFIAVTQIHNNTTWCKYLAVVLHWSLLAAQTWVVIIAVSLFVKFRSLSVGVERIKRFYIFCAVSFAVPTLLVTVCVILEATTDGAIGYGEHGVCWVTNFHAKLVAYIIPVGGSFAAVFIALVITVVTISRRERAARLALGDGRSTSVNVYRVALKLVLILGVIEVLGFVQIVSSELSDSEKAFNAVFSFMYATARSLRGVLLFVVYVCNRNVLQVFKKKYRQSSSTYTRSTSNILPLTTYRQTPELTTKQLRK